jgi:hypothetical protein
MDLFETLYDHGELLGLAAIVVLGPVVVPVVMTYFNVQSMRKGIQLTAVGRDGYDSHFATAEPFHPWAHATGFDFVGGYTMQLGIKAFVAAWHHRERPCYFVLLIAAGNKIPTFTTEFSAERSLDTTGSDQDMLPAPPGHYKQGFTKTPVDELYRRHMEAEEYLMRVGQVQYQPDLLGLEEAVSRDAKLQSAYIRSLPLWPFRAVYWYYIGKRKKANKSIEEQHRAGVIQMPNDPGFTEFHYVG